MVGREKWLFTIAYSSGKYVLGRTDKCLISFTPNKIIMVLGNTSAKVGEVVIQRVAGL